MRAKKVKDLSNQELVDEYGYIAAKEATWIPGPNGRGIKQFEQTMQQSQLLRIELLSRLGESKESDFSYTWEQETWADDAKRSSKLQEHLNHWATDKKCVLTLTDALEEAIYLLGTFDETGGQRETARKEMRLIRSFIRKYKRLLS
ncbi:hypothetical protein [Paenibacillus sp. NPDC055715]